MVFTMTSFLYHLLISHQFYLNENDSASRRSSLFWNTIMWIKERGHGFHHDLFPLSFIN